MPPPPANTRFTHNPAKGSLTTETDRLYLWTLVLALEYEDTYTFTPKLPAQDETGFMKLLREAVFVNSCVDPKEAAAEIAIRDAQMHYDATAADEAAAAAAAAVPAGVDEAQGHRTGAERRVEEGKEAGGDTGGDTGGAAGVYGSGGCRGEMEVGVGESAIEAGHQEGGGGCDVSRSARGDPIRGGFGSGDQAYRDNETSSGAAKSGGDTLGPSAGDAVGGSRAGAGAVLVGRMRANSGGDSGDIETGAGGENL